MKLKILLLQVWVSVAMDEPVFGLGGYVIDLSMRISNLCV